MLNIIQKPEDYEAAMAKGKPVILMFSAGWCPPCRAFKPKVAKAAEEVDSIVFCYLDVDLEAIESVVSKWAPEALPTLIYVEGGEKKAKMVGANESTLAKWCAGEV
eukprot:TRINITY_DN93954_c0_g1_i1.p1 TRINITY_DN93954_c0_g1~~TRINITY_DN93954_c0_g1_i1.p1  ORF type:complete len:106 (+),score=35.03 TRINITY_DN93954_c0_g1_i1:95-412(+)